MNGIGNSALKMTMANMLMQAPQLIVCLIAIVILSGKRRQDSRTFFWALMGFGMLFVLSIVSSVIHGILTEMILANRGHAESYSLWFASSNILVIILEAVCLVFLLISILSKKKTPQNPPPMSMPMPMGTGAVGPDALGKFPAPDGAGIKPAAWDDRPPQ